MSCNTGGDDLYIVRHLRHRRLPHRICGEIPAERSLALHKSLIRLMIIMHLVCTLKFEDVEECLLPYYYTTTSFQSAMS